MDLKPRLTCPKCGHTPAIPPYKRIFFLFLRKDAACPGCGTPLENPSWFDDRLPLGALGFCSAGKRSLRPGGGREKAFSEKTAHLPQVRPGPCDELFRQNVALLFPK